MLSGKGCGAVSYTHLDVYKRQEYVMDPMTNSERKIIHKSLSQIEGVESHSEGDDPNRYVVVTSPLAISSADFLLSSASFQSL